MHLLADPLYPLEPHQFDLVRSALGCSDQSFAPAATKLTKVLQTDYQLNFLLGFRIHLGHRRTRVRSTYRKG